MPARIVILSPPFYSHFRPLMALAAALRHSGTETCVACTRAFEPEIAAAGMRFCEIQINRNANTGRATATAQDNAERQRLEEFLDSTRKGPVETLRTQNRHRLADMLANPEELLERIAALETELGPDLWIVDQLSYGATLALIAHGLRFVTFCPPHPLSIPPAGALYSVPRRIPAPFSYSKSDLATLGREARELDRQFTRRFNQLLSPYQRAVESAFRAASPELIIHNYPELVTGSGPQTPAETATTARHGCRRVYCGYCFQPEEGEEEGAAADAWQPMRVVIALGTFLSARIDVLRAAGTAIRTLYPAATIAIGAGDHAQRLRQLIDGPAIIEPFIDQRRLLRGADLFIHHGGVNSFTEALYYEVPMIVMPFSSDQFNVAADVEEGRLGAVLDPNALSVAAMRHAVTVARAADTRAALSRLSRQVRSRGPAFAAHEILNLTSD